MIRALLTAVLGVAVATTVTSCGVKDYCINCEKGDGGVVSDASVDAPADAFVEGDGAICIPTNGGIEICDGKDNDCDGKVDEGDPGGGVTCGTDVGTCTIGTTMCTAGAIVCSGVQPMPEVCDNLDNDCDGKVDEGDPGGGAFCGIAEGACYQGVNRCVDGAIACVGGQGPVPEICNGIDDDCDGKIDEDVPTDGSCGSPAVGLCMPGTMTCVGGGYVCVGGVNPTFQTCDDVDNDCDGKIDEGYNTQTDPLNCGACTLYNAMGVITRNQICAEPNAIAGCADGVCDVAACEPGHYDINKPPAGTPDPDGCEYACTPQGTEVCDGIDDNCDDAYSKPPATPPTGVSSRWDVNADGSPLTPPANFCSQVGACAGAHLTCNGAGGWICIYPASVSTVMNADGSYTIVPETTCDGIDNDCDGKIDEGFNIGSACNNGLAGACESTGGLACATTTTTSCNYTVIGSAASPEICDGIDNDCDGKVDEGGSTGNLPGQNWVTLTGSGTVQIMQYEASRPDATSGSAGSDTGGDLSPATGTVCSKPNVVPWTDITYPEAVNACASAGGRMCTEAEWQASCEQTLPPTYPLAGPTSTSVSANVFVEAENAFANTTINGFSWIADQTENYSGSDDLFASPNSGTTVTAANAKTKAPRLDFQFNLATGTYYIWVRMLSDANGDGAVWAALTASASVPGTPPNTLLDPKSLDEWEWVPSPAFVVSTAGIYDAEIYMEQDGVRVDAIVLSQDGTDLPVQTADVWAYATNPKVSAPTTCNINSAADTVLATASDASCYANGQFQIDLSRKTTDLNDVLQAISTTTAPSVVIVTGAASKAGTLSESGGVSTFTLKDGVSQVSDFEALVATSTLVRLHGAGTAASLFHAATDVVASTQLTATRAYDMTGNVKEWCAARAVGQDPIRGGGADSDEEGATCNLNFSLASDTFFFPNVGFRCCR